MNPLMMLLTTYGGSAAWDAVALFFILHPVQMPDFMDLLLSFARWVGENHWFWIPAATRLTRRRK